MWLDPHPYSEEEELDDEAIERRREMMRERAQRKAMEEVCSHSDITQEYSKLTTFMYNILLLKIRVLGRQGSSQVN